MVSKRTAELVEQVMEIVEIDRELAEVLVDMLGEDVIEFAHTDLQEEFHV